MPGSGGFTKWTSATTLDPAVRTTAYPVPSEGCGTCTAKLTRLKSQRRSLASKTTVVPAPSAPPCRWRMSWPAKPAP
ncbi:hypothetical protein I550_5954 [Mycobacterium intracellulare 1956]|uniref:Uncharacterized protein n=1 Tax=Mycobacterium intracellulare 1956 TaxID=1299331 RepID=X8CFW8_MYCIT|nr:hypothetical protein I550_5954 [Mycobacterium intracellulare 1956]